MSREEEEKCICSQDSYLGKDSSINSSSLSDQYLAQSRNQVGLTWMIQKLVICRWHFTTTLFSSPQFFLLFWHASYPSDWHTLKVLQQTPNLAPLKFLQPSQAIRSVAPTTSQKNLFLRSGRNKAFPSFCPRNKASIALAYLQSCLLSPFCCAQSLTWAYKTGICLSPRIHLI